MRNTEEVLSTLLKEIKSVCDKNKIKFFLHGSTASKALMKEKFDLPYAQICVASYDFKKLINLLEKSMPENRAVDYMASNKNVSCFEARYVDTSTTFIPLKQNSNYYFSGLYVEILVIRQMIPNKIKRSYLNTLEHGWEGRFAYFKNINGVKYKLPAVAVSGMATLAGKEKTSEYIFNQLSDAYGQHYKTAFYIKPYNKKIVTFNSNPFLSLKAIDFLGEKYPVPVKANEYLKKAYSTKWKKLATEPVDNINRMVSTEIPYKEMLEKLEDKGLKYDSLAKKLNKRDAKFAKIHKYTVKKNEIMQIVAFTKDRVLLSEYYQSKMPLIRKQLEEKDYYNLNKSMQKHRRTMVKYLDKGYGFAVNRELFDIQMKIFQMEGKSNIVDTMKRLTPEQYMKDIFEAKD